MAEPSREGTHEIEYATAQVEAVMAKSEAAITILLDRPDGRNRHVAKAVQLILDDNMGPLARRMMQLDEAVDTSTTPTRKNGRSPTPNQCSPTGSWNSPCATTSTWAADFPGR